MSDYEVTTHVQIPEHALHDALERFEHALRGMGAEEPWLGQWLASTDWNDDGSGFVSLGPSLQLRALTWHGLALIAKPYVLGYTDYAIPGTKLPWVQLSLVIEDADGQLLEWLQNGHWKYRVGLGHQVWGAVVRLGGASPGSGVYFSDSATVDEPWDALREGTGDVWTFDAALIPPELASHFLRLPAGYAQVELPEGKAFARQDRWLTLPWLEDESAFG